MAIPVTEPGALPPRVVGLVGVAAPVSKPPSRTVARCRFRASARRPLSLRPPRVSAQGPPQPPQSQMPSPAQYMQSGSPKYSQAGRQLPLRQREVPQLPLPQVLPSAARMQLPVPLHTPVLHDAAVPEQ